jgi:glycerol-3-phosphate acyltransferase PlsX
MTDAPKSGPPSETMEDDLAPIVGKIAISIDAMGGDHGPATIVAGMAHAARKNDDIAFILHGPRAELEPLVAKRGLSGRVVIRDATGVVTMTERPSHVMRNGKGTSMWSTIDSVRAGEASVAVSCGNTGALMAVSMVRLRKLAGVDRPAIACLWPTRGKRGFAVMLDVGADVRADARDLLQYALMGSAYARKGMGIERPRVGLLNVGTEEHKGRPELQEALAMLSRHADAAGFEFVGFVEGGDIPSGKIDVVVTDGFTGNVALKTAEGTASLIGDLLREAFNHTILSRIAAILALTSLRRLRKRIDPRRQNGGVFLGLNGTVVKSHGAADATGVAAAIKLAFLLSQADLTSTIARRMVAVGEIPLSPEGDADPDRTAPGGAQQVAR